MNKDLKQFLLESKINLSKSLIALHTKNEEKYRLDPDSLVTRHMIRYCKKKRKQAQDDLYYYQDQLHTFCESLRA